MRQKKSGNSLMTMLLVLAYAMQLLSPNQAGGAALPLQNLVSTVQLHRFVNSTGHHYYSIDPAKVDAASKPGSSLNYEGPKGWVLKKQINADTVPVFALIKSDEPYGTRHFYTTDMDEANHAILELGWHMDLKSSQGVAFYIASKQLPNTEPFYRLHNVATDDYFYTADLSEKNKPGYKMEKLLLGYIWRAPQSFDLSKADPLNPGPKLPDLLIQKIVEVKENSVTFILKNDGDAPVPSHSADIALYAYDGKTNQPLFQVVQEMEHGLSPHQAMPFTIDISGRSLFMNRFKILVDTGHKVEESNELNNVSQIERGPMLKLNPDLINAVTKPEPVLRIAPRLVYLGKENRGTTSAPQFVYTLSITNWAEVPAEMFAPAPSLPPCNSKSNGPRMSVHIYTQTGKPLQQICWITSPGGLAKIVYTAKTGEPVREQLVLGLEDRQTGKVYKSNPVSVK